MNQLLIGTKFEPFLHYSFTMDFDGKVFLQWANKNDSQLKSPNWSIFNDAKPYLEFLNDSKGNPFPHLSIVSKRIHHQDNDYYKNRLMHYNEFIRSLSVSNKSSLQVLSELSGLYTTIKDQLDRQIDQLELIDAEITKVFKVFIYESKERLKPLKNNPDDYYELMERAKHLYHNGVRKNCFTDILIKKWLPKCLDKKYVPEAIGESLLNGISYYCPKKEQIVEQMVPVYKKLIHFETMKYYALNDMPLITDNEQDMPGEFEPRNETGKKMKDDKKGINELYLPEIIRIANELIEKKGRAWYVTPEGTAKRRFYTDVHRELSTKPGRKKPHSNTIGKRINTHVLK